jgi:hypothetical protein
LTMFVVYIRAAGNINTTPTGHKCQIVQKGKRQLLPTELSISRPVAKNLREAIDITGENSLSFRLSFK